MPKDVIIIFTQSEHMHRMMVPQNTFEDFKNFKCQCLSPHHVLNVMKGLYFQQMTKTKVELAEWVPSPILYGQFFLQTRHEGGQRT